MTGHFGTTALPKLKAALEILDAYLAKTKWVAGPEVTLADIVLVVTISSLEVKLKFHCNLKKKNVLTFLHTLFCWELYYKLI